MQTKIRMQGADFVGEVEDRDGGVFVASRKGFSSPDDAQAHAEGWALGYQYGRAVLRWDVRERYEASPEAREERRREAANEALVAAWKAEVLPVMNRWAAQGVRLRASEWLTLETPFGSCDPNLPQ